MTDQTWQVTVNGERESLSISDRGLTLSAGDDEGQYEWTALTALTFPTSYSAVLEVDGRGTPMGFASTTEQRRFREALEAHQVQAAEAGLELSLPLVPTAAPLVPMTTLPGWPDARITQVLGLVTGRSVMSRGAVSDFGSDLKSRLGGNLGGIERALDLATKQAERQLQSAAHALGADAVLGVAFVMASVSEKAEAILMTGTAVRLSRSDPDDPRPAAPTATEDGATTEPMGPVTGSAASPADTHP